MTQLTAHDPGPVPARAPRRRGRIPGALALAGTSTLLLAACSSSEPAPIPEPPATGNVLDGADVLTDDQEQELERTIETGNDSTDAARVAVLTETEDPGDLEERAREVASQWGVGDEGAENGILVLLVPGAREVRIEVADGARETVSDDDAEQIIEDRMIPAFEDEDWAAGLDQGVSSLYRTAAGEEDPSAGGLPWWGIVSIVGGVLGVVVVLIVWSTVVSRRRRRTAQELLEQAHREDTAPELTGSQRKDYLRWAGRRRRSEILPVAVWLPLYLAQPTSYGADPPSSDSSGSAGGSSFGGGGGFSGGGASGSW